MDTGTEETGITTQGTSDNGVSALADQEGSAPSAGEAAQETPPVTLPTPSPEDKLAVLKKLTAQFDAGVKALADGAKRAVAERLEKLRNELAEKEARLQELEQLKAEVVVKRRDLEEMAADLLERGLVTTGKLTQLGLRLPQSQQASPAVAVAPLATKSAGLSKEQLAAQLPPGKYRPGQLKMDPPQDEAAPKKRERSKEEQAILEILRAPAGLRAVQAGEEMSTINECSMGGDGKDLRLAMVVRPDQDPIVTVVSLARAKTALDLVKDRLKDQGYFFAYFVKTQENAVAMLAFISEVSSFSEDKLNGLHDLLNKENEDLEAQVQNLRNQPGKEDELDDVYRVKSLLWAKIMVVKAAKRAAWKKRQAAKGNHGGGNHSPSSSSQRPGGKGGNGRRRRDNDEE